MQRIALLSPRYHLAFLLLSAAWMVSFGSSAAFCQAAASSASAHSAPPLRVFDPTLIDRSVNPCENFYRFSCNGWLKRNPLPPDQAEYGRFTELYELNRLHLRQILEQASVPSPGRTPNERKIGDEYASCMDVARVNQARTQVAPAGA